MRKELSNSESMCGQGMAGAGVGVGVVVPGIEQSYIILPIVLIFMIAANLFFFGRHRGLEKDKRDTYECGFQAFETPLNRKVEISFYLVAVSFLIFDIETILLLGWTVEPLWAVNMFLFIIILTATLIIEISEGVLNTNAEEFGKPENTAVKGEKKLLITGCGAGLGVEHSQEELPPIILFSPAEDDNDGFGTDIEDGDEIVAHYPQSQIGLFIEELIQKLKSLLDKLGKKENSEDSEDSKDVDSPEGPGSRTIDQQTWEEILEEIRKIVKELDGIDWKDAQDILQLIDFLVGATMSDSLKAMLMLYLLLLIGLLTHLGLYYLVKLIIQYLNAQEIDEKLKEWNERIEEKRLRDAKEEWTIEDYEKDEIEKQTSFDNWWKETEDGIKMWPSGKKLDYWEKVSAALKEKEMKRRADRAEYIKKHKK